jgi:hypothetical protein
MDFAILLQLLSNTTYISQNGESRRNRDGESPFTEWQQDVIEYRKADPRQEIHAEAVNLAVSGRTESCRCSSTPLLCRERHGRGGRRLGAVLRLEGLVGL